MVNQASQVRGTPRTDTVRNGAEYEEASSAKLRPLVHNGRFECRVAGSSAELQVLVQMTGFRAEVQVPVQNWSFYCRVAGSGADLQRAVRNGSMS